MEENINIPWNVSTGDEAKQAIMNIMNNRMSADDYAIKRAKDGLLADWQEMWDTSADVDDEAIKYKYKVVSNYNNIAYMIYNASVRNGAKWLSSNPRDIMNLYWQEFPENRETIRNAVYDTDLDLTKFWMEQWWLPNEDEDKAANWLERVAWDFLSAFDLAWKWLRNFTAWAEKALWEETKENAIQEYAWDKYGKSHLFSKISDDEWNNIDMMAMNNPDMFKDYEDEQRMDYGAVDAVEWTAFSTLETLAMSNPWSAWLLWGFLWMAETPYIDIVPQALMYLSARLWEVPYDVALVITRVLAPDVYNYLKDFPEDKKERAFMLAGGIIWGKVMSSKFWQYYTNPLVNKLIPIKKAVDEKVWNAKDWALWKLWDIFSIKKDIESSWTQQSIIDKLSRLFKKEADANKIREQMYDKANKTLVNPEVRENKQATNAYVQLSPEAIERIKKSKNKSQTLLEEFDKLSKAYENSENMIVDTIDKMYGIDSTYENPISTKAGGKDYTSNKPRKYVKEWIELMKEIVEYQEEQQYIDLAEQIAIDWNLTPYNIIEMARSASKQFDIWSRGKEWPELAKTKARVDSIRQWLKDMLKRELDRVPEWQETGVNPLEYYDSLWSPIIWTRSNIVKLRSAWNKAKSRIPDKTVLNKLWTWVEKIPFTKTKAVREILDQIQWENILSMISKENGLGDAISSIEELNKKLPKDATKEQIDAIMEDWAKNHPWAVEAVEWVIEWEVIEPTPWKWTKWRNPYLEEMFDTVDIVDPNLYVWVDTKYNWQSPIDYTDVTMVTEEWYPWRPWKTTESYKWQQKWEWWTPSAWNESAENYAAKHWNTLEWWKKQLKAAWISEEVADVLIEKLAKKNFKASAYQSSLFEWFPTKEETATIVKGNKWEPKATLQDVLEELNKLEESTEDTVKKAESKSKSKKVSQEDIDHLFWKDKTSSTPK